MNEEHMFKVEVTVRGVNGPPETIHREYKSRDSVSAHGAAREILDGIRPETLSRMRGVSDAD